MAFFEDVLDATGRTPRELGAIQLFVESCVRGDTGDAVLTVWVQAAFANCAGAIVCADRRWPVPPLEDGRVLRGRLPLKLAAEATSFAVSADCPVKDSSPRVRAAWKLTDTFAVTHTESASMGMGGIGATLALNAVTLPLGVAIIPGSVAATAVQTNVRVEKARSLPGLSCAVTQAVIEPLSEAVWEPVWTVGGALPAVHVQTESKLERWSDEVKPAQDFAPATGESPWAFAQALMNSGYPLSRVRDLLVQEKGLTEADAALLLAGVAQTAVAAPDDGPAAEAAQDVTRTGLNLGPVLGLGIMVLSLGLAVVAPTPITLLIGVVGLVLGALRAYSTFGAFRARPTIDPTRLQKLTAEDPSPRCSRHPEFASLGSCSRCGTFSCRVCAPFESFPERAVCSACDSLPSVRLERLAEARRSTGLVCLAHLGLFIITLAVLVALAAPGLFVMTGLLVLCVGLAGTQFKVNGVWPALFTLPLGFALLVVSTFALSSANWSPVALLLWPLWFAAGATLLTMASTQRGQVRAIGASTSQG